MDPRMSITAGMPAGLGPATTAPWPVRRPNPFAGWQPERPELLIRFRPTEPR